MYCFVSERNVIYIMFFFNWFYIQNILRLNGYTKHTKIYNTKIQDNKSKKIRTQYEAKGLTVNSHEECEYLSIILP